MRTRGAGIGQCLTNTVVAITGEIGLKTGQKLMFNHNAWIQKTVFKCLLKIIVAAIRVVGTNVVSDHWS